MSKIGEKEKEASSSLSSSSLFKKSLDGLKQIRPLRTSFFSKEESKKIRIPKLKQIANIPRTLKPWERIVIFILSGIILASIVFWIDIYYLKHSKLVPAQGGQYTEGLTGQPKYVNPILAQTNDIDMDLAYLIFSGLMIYNDKQELAPDLAQDYKISEDKKTYTFTLKPNLIWQDGEPLTADDIIFTIHRIQDPDFKSPLRSSFLGVEMEKIDALNLKFTLKEPYAPFLSTLTFGILPMHIWETIPSANAPLSDYNLKPIGSGPWQFYKLKKNKEGGVESYFLKPNPHYYGLKPYLEKINFQFYPEFDTLISDLQSRQIDGAGYIPKEYKNKLAHNDFLNLYSLKLPHIYSIFLNPNRNKLFKEKYIREALEYATPKKQIIEEAIADAGQITYSPLLLADFSPERASAPRDTDNLTKREFNPQRAEQILEQGGWTKGADGIYAKGKDRLSFTLATTDWPEYVQTAEILKTAYRQTGIELITESYNTAKIQQEYIRPRNFDALLYGEVLVHNPDLYIFWHSSQIRDPGLNLASFENTEADKIMEELRTINDPDLRQEDYKKLEQILNQEIPVIPLYRSTYLCGVNKRIKGIETAKIVFPYERFTRLSHWYIEQKRQLLRQDK